MFDYGSYVLCGIVDSWNSLPREVQSSCYLSSFSCNVRKFLGWINSILICDFCL